MRFARVLGGVGRLLIWVGAIILAFVAYQLWGTNIAEARAQNDLDSQFEDLLTTTTTTAPPPPTTVVTPDTSTTTTTLAPIEIPPEGEAVAQIVIPKIGVDKIVVEGVGRNDLKKGPGHYPGTPLPGQSGNASIAGHRTTYGAPFNRVDELAPGDMIEVTTQQGSFEYRVTSTEIVLPSDVEVIEDKGDDRLTLTSCHPKYSARQRIIVSAELVDEPAPTPPTLGFDETPAPEEQQLEVLDGDERGPIGPAILWGLAAFAVWLFFYLLSRKWRRWPAYVLGAPCFAVAVFVFFEAVAETLPANF